MAHLQTLTVYNNELSDLDSNLDFLSGFVYLEHLELYDNPLSEEPYYKLKAIFNLK
jgi:Leucine-rich repeat (LRR) protein